MFYEKYDVSVICGKPKIYDIYVERFYKNVVFHAVTGYERKHSWLRLVKETTAWKVSKYGVFSGPYFPAFGLNTENRILNRILRQYGASESNFLVRFDKKNGWIQKYWK